MPLERLQKILAHAGVASRRAAEQLITDGRVRVNGRRITELGAKADPVKDKIEVNGKRVVAEKPVYYVLNKPREVVTTLDDPEGRETVGKLMRKVAERVYPVGRLDYHTSGVLLMTNDGDMAQALLHPTRQVPKTYVAKIRGAIPLPALEQLRKGVVLDTGERTRKAEVFVVNEERGNTWVQLTITEGKNRQIHRMFEALGHRVMRLSRTAFAGIDVEGMPPGAYRQLTRDELRKLKRDYRNPARKARAAVRKDDTWTEGEAWQDFEDDLDDARPAPPQRKKMAPRAGGNPPGGSRKKAATSNPRGTKKRAPARGKPIPKSPKKKSAKKRQKTF
ncbi:MAG: pseudouridine synthase [Myxococcales bacterium]|jgi:23S rRNA pseudouridine2605 synthase